MTITLIFSDLHANRRALLEIENVIDNFDFSIFCGDILGYGKDIDYSLNFIVNKIDIVVLGNHDKLIVSGESLINQHPVVRESIMNTRKELSKTQIELISSLPIEVWHKDMYITHTLGDDYLKDENDFKRFSSKMRDNTNYVLFGHTHQKVLYNFNGRTVINPGSITKGRNGFNRSYAILNEKNIEFINLENIL
jgi:putative phosphoesterase